MKVICNRAKLAENMEYVNEVASQARTTKPILQCVRMQADEDKLTLCATDLELGIRCELKEIQIEDAGQVVVGAAKFSSLLHELTDETITLKLVEDVLELSAASGTYKFYTFPAEEFPPVAIDEAATSAVVLAQDIADVIDLTVYAVAKETTRYAINGLLIEIEKDKLTAVGTDGRRLAWAYTGLVSGSDEKVSCIVHPHTMQMLARLAARQEEDAQITIRISENGVTFELPNIVLVSSIVEGKFPDYGAIIPKEHSCRIVMERQEFLAVLRRVMVFTQTKDVTHGARLKPEDGKVIVDVPSSEIGEATEWLSADISGEPVQIGFDPRYMLEPLRALDEEQVILELKAPKVPLLLKAGGNFTYILMPVTI